MFKRAASHLLLPFFILPGAGVCGAQVDLSGLNGTVSDPSGKLVPGVRVVAYMADTGLRRETTTSREGTYEIPELPVGAYTISFTANGFATMTFDRVVQASGRTTTR